MALRATVETVSSEDGRGFPRRKLTLASKAAIADDLLYAEISDLSRSGMLLTSQLPLSEGETIVIDLPIAGLQSARVVWIQGELAGCEFLEILPQAVVSAALLLAPFQPMESLSPANYDRAPATPVANWVVVGALTVLAAWVLMLLVGLALV